jgi:prolyl-tRNA synthetase
MFWSILNQSKTFFNKTMISIGIMELLVPQLETLKKLKKLSNLFKMKDTEWMTVILDG